MAEYNLNHGVHLNDEHDNFAKIKVIGVGGGGCNAINRMIESNVQGIQFIAVNTDYQVLERSKANEVLRIGEKVTRGLGAGMDRNKGASAANESKDELAELLRGADMVFVTAGMGGGTGTGAAPVIAQIARDMGILTVGVVTRPFGFEGASRRQNADAGLAELEQAVDSLIVVPNDKLIEIANDDMSFEEAFAFADQVLKYGVAGISDLIAIPGLINLDLADIRRVMSNAGMCHMGIGRASGQDRVNVAIEQAIHSPLLDTSIDGAHRVIINFTGDSMKLKEINLATTMVRDAVAQDADIIFGAVPNPNMQDEIMITVIASGFEKNGKQSPFFPNSTGPDLGPAMNKNGRTTQRLNTSGLTPSPFLTQNSQFTQTQNTSPRLGGENTAKPLNTAFEAGLNTPSMNSGTIIPNPILDGSARNTTGFSNSTPRSNLNQFNPVWNQPKDNQNKLTPNAGSTKEDEKKTSKSTSFFNWLSGDGEDNFEE